MAYNAIRFVIFLLWNTTMCRSFKGRRVVEILFWVGIAVGAALIVWAFVLDDNDTSPVLAILGLFLILGTGIAALIIGASRHDARMAACREAASFPKGSKVGIKNIDKPFVVIEVKCEDSEKQLRSYKLVSPDGLFLEAKESDLTH